MIASRARDEISDRFIWRESTHGRFFWIATRRRKISVMVDNHLDPNEWIFIVSWYDNDLTYEVQGARDTVEKAKRAAEKLYDKLQSNGLPKPPEL